MSVKDFMTTDLVVVQPKTRVFDAVDLMKEHHIHRLPVIDNGQLVGLITEGTIQAALPSKATSLSVHEINYLLNKTTIGDIMLTNVQTISPNAPLEAAIAVMRKNNVGVLPVLEGDKVCGIITNNDIFDAFLSITGYEKGGTRVQLSIAEDHTGILANITQLLADHNYSIYTIVVHRKTSETIVELEIQSEDVDNLRELFTNSGYHVVAVEKNETYM